MNAVYLGLDLVARAYPIGVLTTTPPPGDPRSLLLTLVGTYVVDRTYSDAGAILGQRPGRWAVHLPGRQPDHGGRARAGQLGADAGGSGLGGVGGAPPHTARRHSRSTCGLNRAGPARRGANPCQGSVMSRSTIAIWNAKVATFWRCRLQLDRRP
jgi:hypothetical protein